MEVFPASVALVIRALVISARWAGRARRLALEQATGAADANREAALEARVTVLEAMLEQRDAHIEVLESRLGKERPRKPYPLMERLRIIWLMQYFDIPGRRLKEMLGVSRSSVRRWLKGFEEGKLGKGNEPKEPVNKTPREIAELIWEIFRQNPLWGRWRIAMVLWGLGVFVAASTVRNILLRPRPEASAPAVAHAKEAVKPRQIIARYPNHVWSVDRTRVWRWHIWPTYSNPVKPYSARFLTLEAVCLPADAPTQAPPRERSSLPPLVAATPPALPRGNPTLARSDRGADSRNLPSSTIAETRRQRRMLGEKVTLPAAPLAR